MSTLQKRFPQLICITHLKNIKEMFNEKLLVIKTNGDSKVTN